MVTLVRAQPSPTRQDTTPKIFLYEIKFEIYECLIGYRSGVLFVSGWRRGTRLGAQVEWPGPGTVAIRYHIHARLEQLHFDK